MTLRSRLFLSLFALALVPTLLFAWFTLVQLHAATARWYQSGVEHALESALETNRAALDRLESMALDRAETWAAAYPTIATDPRQRQAVRNGLRDSGPRVRPGLPARLHRMGRGRHRRARRGPAHGRAASG
jgi:nitrogen fixation/metabolism regulation signal transduction histidine kinase